MKNWFSETLRIFAPILIVAFGIGGFMVFGKRPDVKNEIPVAPIPPVQTVAAVKSPGELTIEVEGVAAPSRQIAISAEVEGRIVKKAPQSRAGKFVTKGDLLLQIDPVNYKLDVDRLAAQVAQSRAELAAIGVQIDNNEKLISLASEDHAMNRRELDRHAQLAKKGVSTESHLDTIRGAELASRRALQTLRNEAALLLERKNSQQAALTLTEAQLARAAEDLKRTEIKSPLDGMVITDGFELDNFVKRGDQLLKISDTKHLEITSSLTVDELFWVWMDSGLLTGSKDLSVQQRMELPQKEVEAVYDLHGTKYVWKGKLSRYEGSGLDAQTRTVPCRVLVEDPTDLRVIPPKDSLDNQSAADSSVSLPSMYVGMYLTIRVPVHSPVTLIEIPAVALRPGNDVWIVRDNKLHVINSDVMRRESHKVYLRGTSDGIQPGDRVVTSPLSFAQDGLPVQEIAGDAPKSDANETTAEVSAQ